MRPAIGLVTLVLLTAGCGDTFGPERMPTTSVTGRIHIRGQPVRGGWVEFLPVGGTVGRLRSAAVGADGRFAADRVPIGRVAICLVGSPLGPTGDPALDGFLSELRRRYAIERVIPDRPAEPIDIDLAVEAKRAASRATTAP
jgi:hypothetical protein